MDGQDEILTNNNNNIGAQYVVKGKRTKRQRPQSPIPFRMITGSPTTTINSYKSDQGSDICSSNNNNLVEDTTTTAATTTNVVSDDDDIYFLDGGATTIDTTTTEEEEDMAKCLILLAQGHSRELPPQQPPPPLLSLGQTGVNHNYNNIPTNGNNTTKFVSRKFMESGKSGYYVYECKTCSKTFSSFQALGGHRASHKKPKNKDEDYNNAIKNRSNHNFNTYLNTNTNTKNYINNNNNYTSNIMISSDDEDPPFKLARHNNNNNNNFASSTSLSLQLTNRALYSGISNHHNKGRVHECSICGAEFSSGQALGGHMRRHRGPVNPVGAPSAPPAIPAIPISMEQPSGPTEMCDDFMLTTMKMAPPINNNSSSALSLDLDLNLPAPPEETSVGDHQKEANKFVFESKQQQPESTNEREQQPPSPPPLPPSPPPPPPPPQQQQPPQQQIVLSSPALVDCHY